MSKVLPIERIAELVSGRVVQCHGCFDLAHYGHILYLEESRKLGDTLVVTVTSDKYVNKGDGRPINNEMDRANVLAALRCVDYVAINDAPDACMAIRILRPDFYVKHKEYEMTECAEFETARLLGAEIVFTDTPKYSTTEIIEKCKSV